MTVNTSLDDRVFADMLITRHHRPDDNFKSALGPSVQPLQQHVIPKSSPECVFSETQPLPGSVDILVSYN